MSRFGRLARLSSLGTRVAARALEGGVRGALAPEGLRNKVRNKLQSRTAEEMAETLSQLKGAAMKVGQQVAMAASTLDLPEDVQRTLSKLHANAEPVPFDVVQRAIETSLDAPISELYAHLDPTPIGTASLGQAHAATLHDGREVVVKVLHPGIREGLETDLLAIRAVLLSGRLFGREKAELEDIFEEVSVHLRLELDYLQEAANIERFAQIYGNDSRFCLPGTVPSHCSETVLTMGRVRGIGLDDFVAADADDFVARGAAIALDRERLAALRAGMRDRLARSSLLDAARVCAALEDGYRDAWRAWCTGGAPTTAAPDAAP